MEACAFDEENGVLDPPHGVSLGECSPLPVWRGPLENGNLVVISCWKLTEEEMEEVKRTGRVWLLVWGSTMPPVYPTGRSPFKE